MTAPSSDSSGNELIRVLRQLERFLAWCLIVYFVVLFWLVAIGVMAKLIRWAF